MVVAAKPLDVFDRAVEWAELQRFLDGGTGRLGVMWGARRTGKSYLLSALCEEVGGLYIQAVRQDAELFRAWLGRVLGERLELPAPLQLGDWETTIASLLDLADTPLVVLDEFPYLVEGSPEVPTVVQAAVDERSRRRSGAKLLLCGSAVSQMTNLLGADGPLYRRAALSMALQPFDLRAGARYWGLEQRPADALLHRAIVGGVPGYRDVFGDVGSDLHVWIAEQVLDPTRSTFHEDELVFAQDPTLPDANVYRSVLAAIAAGDRTPTGIARTTGRKVTSLGRSLDRLVGAGLVVRINDPLREKRALLELGDPFLRFHYAIIRPNRAAVARRRGRDIWERAEATFRSQVLGPQLEVICRDAVLDVDLGMPPVSDVGATTLHDPPRRATYEVDIVGTDEDGQISLLGEVKASESVRTVDDLARLDRLRELVPPARRAAHVHLALFAVGGADQGLRHAARQRSDLSVIDASTLLGGPR